MHVSVGPLLMDSHRPGGEGGESTGTRVDAVGTESLPTPLAASGVTSPEVIPAGTTHDVEDDQSCVSPTSGGAQSRLVVRRICVEKEAARRSRICLQQLESWKNLRVEAWRERVTLLRPEERSASLRSLSVPTRDGREASSEMASPAHFLQTPNDVSDRTLSPLRTSEDCIPGTSCLEKFYEGEVVRAATRRVRQEELERQTQEAAERRRAEEARRRQEREAEARRRMEEMEALRQQEREAQRLLREETVRREEAEEHARRAADRAQEAAAELQRLQQAYGGAKTFNKDALEGLKSREQQVEVLSADMKRLTDANAALRRRIKELEQEIVTARETEAVGSSLMQELQRELAEMRQSNEEKEKALREANLTLQQMQCRTSDSERERRAATSAAEESCRRADELAVQQSEAQDATEALCAELQRCRDDAAQSLMEQAARFEALLTANESAAAASQRQLQRDLAMLRRDYDVLLQERVVERAAMEARSKAQEQEVRRLHEDLVALQKRRDVDTAELAERRRELQVEVARNDEAEQLLRNADTAITTMAARLAEQQKERAEESVQCEGLETGLRNTNHRLQRFNPAVSEQPQPQHQRSFNSDLAALRSSFPRDEGGAGLCDAPEVPVSTSNWDSSALLARGGGLQPVAAHSSHRDVSIGRLDASLDTRLRTLVAEVESAVEVMLSARDHALRWSWREEEQPQQRRQRLNSVSPVTEKTFSEGNRLLAAGCVVKLMEAVTLLDGVLQTVHPASMRAASAAGRSHENGDGPAEHLQRQQQTLRLLMQEMQEAKMSGHRRASAAAVLLYDPLIEPLAKAVVERLDVLLEHLRRGELSCRSHASGTADLDALMVEGDDIAAFASSPPRPPRPVIDSDTEAAAATATAANVNATRQLHSDGGGVGTTPRHTFGFMGGRLQVSNNGTRLQRLVLPGVVDTMTSSALGAVDHRSFLSLQHSAVPPCFEYTIRVGMYCDGLLIGFADRYLQLEGFGPARNSLRYANCYYLHLGRGTLFCPAQGIVDMPYRTFQRAAPASVMEGLPGSSDRDVSATSTFAAVRVGEEVSCSLDTVTHTIRFRRDGVDCGVAFARVSLMRALFPAFEVSSRGCTIEFV
ncbi:hypothetical protein TRSC58_06062 [Trypanosoma rangeli SC58]|uniref:SPRY domain-containing protein n=1 Tax=Trypanosoma rangeli SC58 TaxID=429131 RepID=A0A061IWK8_TRYRA|nr:hypothetical protein TRSC58_06062 [Trypanosoma rangeli SC58]